MGQLRRDGRRPEARLPLGGDGTQNLTRILVEDSVQGLGRNIGLVKFDDLVSINIEALPVDNQILGDLIDPGRGLIWTRNIALTGGHHTTLWIGKSGSRMEGKKQGYGEGNFEKIAEEFELNFFPWEGNFEKIAE